VLARLRAGRLYDVSYWSVPGTGVVQYQETLISKKIRVRQPVPAPVSAPVPAAVLMPQSGGFWWTAGKVAVGAGLVIGVAAIIILAPGPFKLFAFAGA
jgi:hypothetical protein